MSQDNKPASAVRGTGGDSPASASVEYLALRIRELEDRIASLKMYPRPPSIFSTPEMREEMRHDTQTTLPRRRYRSQERQTTSATDGLFPPSLSMGVQSSPRRCSNRASHSPGSRSDGCEFVREFGADVGMWNTSPPGSGSSFFSSASNIGIEGGHFSVDSSTFQNRTNLTINLVHSPLADNTITGANISSLPHNYSCNAPMLPYGQNTSPLGSMGTTGVSGPPFLSSRPKPQAASLPVLQFEIEKFPIRERMSKKRRGRRIQLISRHFDEDNADDEDEDGLVEAQGAKWGGNGGTDSPQIPPRRASAVGTLAKGREKEYKSRAVQTDRPEGSSDDIQVEAAMALPPTRSSLHSSVPQRRWTQAPHLSAMTRDTIRSSNAFTAPNILQSPPTAPPNGMRGVKPTKAISSSVSPDPGSPREFLAPHSTASNGWADETPTVVSPSTDSIASPSVGLPSLPSSVGLVPSKETYLASPSSISPVYTMTTVIPTMGKGKRVWDPARDVDACKRDSIDALSRFWNMVPPDHERNMSSNDQV